MNPKLISKIEREPELELKIEQAQTATKLAQLMNFYLLNYWHDLSKVDMCILLK